MKLNTIQKYIVEQASIIKEQSRGRFILAPHQDGCSIAWNLWDNQGEPGHVKGWNTSEARAFVKGWNLSRV
jgi:hypothetical protein